MDAINNFQRILIAIDDSPYSEKAAQYGFHLARLMGAHVALLNVMDPPSSTYSGDPLLGQQPLVMPEIIDMQEEASKSVLERYGSIWNSDNELITFSKVGNPRVEILATADEWRADLIILGTHGRTGFDHFISGSVAEGVARRSACPVLIVPNKTDQ
ncbi:universal stress protein [Albibacterium sp.]|uniref:universal stress protein n=1 Tax=Albibacterium sp. TaxID=2952885 RepID=UPI002B518FCB|nr:universal stress protein [Albibacterium sp.]HUH18855.1 universal stress protein [Albibacterium sp.]